jgi:CheY-like chemotaxis protein
MNRLEMKMVPATQTMKKPTVLVIEDEPQICRLMERCLAGRVEEVLIAADPNTALEILKQKHVTHLLSDLFLQPAANTLASLTLLRFVFRNIVRCVVFTAADAQSVEEAQRRMPFHSQETVDAVVSKMDGVEAVIDALLGEKR